MNNSIALKSLFASSAGLINESNESLSDVQKEFPNGHLCRHKDSKEFKEYSTLKKCNNRGDKVESRG